MVIYVFGNKVLLSFLQEWQVDNHNFCLRIDKEFEKQCWYIFNYENVKGVFQIHHFLQLRLMSLQYSSRPKYWLRACNIAFSFSKQYLAFIVKITEENNLKNNFSLCFHKKYAIACLKRLNEECMLFGHVCLVCIILAEKWIKYEQKFLQCCFLFIISQVNNENGLQ